MRHRATGILFVLSGTCFLAGVLDPPILPTWGGSATDVMATAAASSQESPLASAVETRGLSGFSRAQRGLLHRRWLVHAHRGYAPVAG